MKEYSRLADSMCNEKKIIRRGEWKMNTITIKFGQGTEAWKDMQEVVKVLHGKGYIAQPYEDIGTVKLTKEIKEEN